VTEKEIHEHAERVWKQEADALLKLSKIIDKKAMARCIELFEKCRSRIITSGAGTSAAAAKKIAHTFSCVERPSFFLSPSDAVHGGLGAVQEGDIAVLISKGGNTEEVVNLIPSLKKKKVYIVGVTENEESKLARESDLFLRVRVEKEADPFNMLATTSTMAVIAVFDAISIILMKKTGFTKAQFAVIHPGGAVGRRLVEGEGKTK